MLWRCSVLRMASLCCMCVPVWAMWTSWTTSSQTCTWASMIEIWYVIQYNVVCVCVWHSACACECLCVCHSVFLFFVCGVHGVLGVNACVLMKAKCVSDSNCKLFYVRKCTSHWHQPVCLALFTTRMV